MKNLLLAFIIFSFSNICISQDDKALYFNEVSFGVNQTYGDYSYKHWIDSKVTNLYGVNLGFYHVYFKEKTINLISGFEYNLLNIKLNYSYDNNYRILKKETYLTHHLISIPLFFRFSFGDQKKFMFEAGVNYNLMHLKHNKGTTISTLKNEYTPSDNEPLERVYSHNNLRTSNSTELHIGIGHNFNWSGKQVFMKFAYRKAIISILNSSKTDNYFKLDIGLTLNNDNNKVNPSPLDRKFSHTFYLGHPRGLFHGSKVAVSGHYEFGFAKSEKNMLELKVSYVLYKYSSGGWFNQINGNSQTFLIQFGGRHYFNKPKNKVRPYISGHLGGELVNYENGKNLILPAFSGGVHLELDHRLSIGVDVEGLMPNAYFKVGYRFF